MTARRRNSESICCRAIYSSVAGTDIAGADAAFAGVLGTAITRFRNLEIGRTGLTEREAVAAGFDATGVTTEACWRALPLGLGAIGARQRT